MTNVKLLQYLEAAKVEELTRELTEQGYAVSVPPAAGAAEGVDLIAVKDGRHIAYQVKALPRLRELASELSRVRDTARERGFDEVRLVIVNPPRERSVEVEGLEHALRDYLIHGPPPHELDALSSHTRIDDLHDVDIESLTADAKGLHVSGQAVVSVELTWGGGEEADGVTATAEFPLRFDLSLDRDMKIRDVNQVSVDTSGFYAPQ